MNLIKTKKKTNEYKSVESATKLAACAKKLVVRHREIEKIFERKVKKKLQECSSKNERREWKGIKRLRLNFYRI